MKDNVVLIALFGVIVMSIKVKRKKARKVNIFNREIGYKPKRDIYDIICDVVDKYLNGLEFKSDGVFKNGEEDS